MVCKRCGKDMEYGEIHLFRGGEDRRSMVENIFKTKVTLCLNPPSPEFWMNGENKYGKNTDNRIWRKRTCTRMETFS